MSRTNRITRAHREFLSATPQVRDTEHEIISDVTALRETTVYGGGHVCAICGGKMKTGRPAVAVTVDGQDQIAGRSALAHPSCYEERQERQEEQQRQAMRRIKSALTE